MDGKDEDWRSVQRGQRAVAHRSPSERALWRPFGFRGWGNSRGGPGGPHRPPREGGAPSDGKKDAAPGWTRTTNLSVNSRTR